MSFIHWPMNSHEMLYIEQYSIAKLKRAWLLQMIRDALDATPLLINRFMITIILSNTHIYIAIE